MSCNNCGPSPFQLERLRNRVVQTAFSTPGAALPEREIGDDELIEELHRLLGGRRELLARITALEHDVQEANAGTDNVKDQGDVLKEALQGSLVSAQEKDLNFYEYNIYCNRRGCMLSV